MARLLSLSEQRANGGTGRRTGLKLRRATVQVRLLLCAFSSTADVAETVDAPDLKSGETSWGFDSLHPHQITGPFV